MIRELDRVVLTTNLSEHGLKKGDVGTVVLVHGSSGYEVEFLALDGSTVAIASVSSRDVRRVKRGEITHARSIRVA